MSQQKKVFTTSSSQLRDYYQLQKCTFKATMSQQKKVFTTSSSQLRDYYQLQKCTFKPKRIFQYQTITICHHYFSKCGTYSVTAKQVASGLKILSGKHK